jgi:hypothetical protein
MKFWASSESYGPAGVNVERARQIVEPYLVKALNESLLKNVELEIRYVPIVMPSDMHKIYPQRSRAHVKKKIFDCAPHLCYEVFNSTDYAQQISQYVRGIEQSVPHLAKFGLTPVQIEAFEHILVYVEQNLKSE